MRILKDITEDEMIATFLAEARSSRFGECIRDRLATSGKDLRIVDKPDVGNTQENARRRDALRYCREGLLRGFPTSVRWVSAMLTREDLVRVHYINHATGFMSVGKGSRRPIDAVAAIRGGAPIPEISREEFQDTVDAVRNGMALPRMIIVSGDNGVTFVVMEGHKRLTAYLFDPQFTPPEIEVVLGFSSDFVRWPFY